jgi:hypothetical protein
MADLRFEFVIKLEQPTSLPFDTEHVLTVSVLASHPPIHLSRQTPLQSNAGSCFRWPYNCSPLKFVSYYARLVDIGPAPALADSQNSRGISFNESVISKTHDKAIAKVIKGVDGDTFDELTDIKNSQTKAIQ